MTLASPVFTGTGGTITSWEVHPALPAGISLDSSNGEISGIPTVLSTQTTYTYMLTIPVEAHNNHRFHCYR